MGRKKKNKIEEPLKKVKLFNYNNPDEIGFSMTYCKIGSSPKSIFLRDRNDVLNFLFKEIKNIDYIGINDRVVNKNRLINNNLVLSRYLKLTHENEL
jgi:hypothetical protein